MKIGSLIRRIKRRKEMKKELTQEAPWETYAKKLCVLFEGDECIKVYAPIPNDDGYSMRITTTMEEKYDALLKRMPKVRRFGNVNLYIQIGLIGGDSIAKEFEDYNTIFAGNTAFKDSKLVEDPAGYRHGYIRFWPDVIQFSDDNLADYEGLWSGLAQDIANDAFDDGSRMVHFCTANRAENGDLQSED